MALESGVVPVYWRPAVIVPLYKGKGGRTECSNYRDISLLSVAGKIYAWILVESPSSDDEEGGFQSREGVCRSGLHLKAEK